MDIIVMLSIIFIFMPIIGFTFAIIGYFLDNKTTKNIIYCIIIALFLGILAYNFIPMESYDLYRHHQLVETFFGKNIGYVFNYANTGKTDLEIMPLFIIFLCSKLNNVNFLQFFVTSTGYFLIFYMLSDYRKIKKIKNNLFILISAFTFFSFNTLNFISGLWYYLATIIFAFALYNDYIKQKNKIACFITYFITIFFHSSMMLPFCLVSLYKLFKNKITMKKIIIIAAIIYTSPNLLSLFNNIINIDFFKTMEYTLNSYMVNDQAMHAFYGGKVLALEILKLAVIMFFMSFKEKKERNSNLNGLIILLTFSTLVLLRYSVVMIRFVILTGFIAIPLMIDILSNKKTKNHLVLILVMTATLMIYVLYFLKVFYAQNFGDLFKLFFVFLNIL